MLAGNYDVSVELSHDGGLGGVVQVVLSIGNTTTDTTVSLNASETTLVTFENTTGGLSPDIYNVTVSAVNTSVAGEVTLSVDVNGNGKPAADTDDDRRLDNVNGDEAFDIFDVQALFEQLS